MTRYHFTEYIPDLIEPEEYREDVEGRRVKLRLRITERGLEIVGDAVRPEELERLLLELDPEVIEQMLCG
ncbi:MAG: hypothetical protein Tsb0020_11290 [Haliangiales bacterium]